MKAFLNVEFNSCIHCATAIYHLKPIFIYFTEPSVELQKISGNYYFTQQTPAKNDDI